MTLFRTSLISLTTLTLCVASMWYIVKYHSSRDDTSNSKVVEQQSLVQSMPAQSKNPFGLTKSSAAETSTISLLAGNNRDIIVSSGKTNATGLGVDPELLGCGLQCKQAIEALKLPYAINDDEYEKLHSQISLSAAYLQANPNLIDELVEIAVQAGGNKRQIIMTAFSLLPEHDRLRLGQALIESNSERHRLDGIQVLASTDSMSQHWVEDFAALLISEQSGIVRQSVVKALNRPEIFKGNAEVLAILSQAMQADSDASVRGKALLASARLTYDPQSLLNGSFTAIRSERSEYQHYGVRAVEEIFNRHTRNGGEISEYDRSQLGQLVTDLMEPGFENMPVDVRNNIEDLFERFY